MKQRALTLLRARRNDEGGAVLILSVLFLVVMIVCCALAIDIGQQSADRRDDHKVADLAALDASRVIGQMNPCNDSNTLHQWIVDAAVASAQRNGFTYPASGNTIDVDTGNIDPASGVFSSAAACSSSAVKVTIGSITNYKFVPGSQNQSAMAVASQKPGAATQPLSGQFTMGSFLASLNTSDATLLDRILCAPIRGTGPVCSAANNSYLSLDAVSWQGLMAGSTSLQALQQQLVTDGVDVGTTDKLMNTNVSVKKLLQAYAEVLNNQGGVGQAQASGPMGTLAGQSDGTTTVQLGKFLSLDQGQGDTALQTQVNAFRFVTASALAANGTNAIAIPDLGVNVPNTSKVAATLKVIQGPVDVQGPNGTSRTTQQADLLVTPTINKTLSIAGIANLTSATLTGDFPVHVTGGGATGTMQNQNCSNAPGLGALIDPQAFTSAVTSNLNFNATLNVPLVGTSNVTAGVPVTGSETSDGQPGSAVFAYTAEFLPNQVSKRVGSTTLGLNTISLAAGNVSFTQGGGLITSQTVVNAALGSLPQLTTDLDNIVVSRISRLLGLNIGGADVTADWLRCNGQIGAIGSPFPVLLK